MSDIEKELKGDWGTGKIHADGSATLQTAAGRFEIAEDGTPTVHLDAIKRVAIENITDVVQYEIHSSDTATSHWIKFKKEGEARFSYRHDGKLLEFSTTHMTVHVSNEQVVTLKRYEDSDEEA